MIRQVRFMVLAAGLLLALLSALAVVPGVRAGEAEDIKAVKAALQKLMPQSQVEPDRITASPLAGLYEVVIGTQVVYVSSDGRYIVRGDVLDLQARQNVTELARRDGRLKALSTIDPKSMVVFKPKETKYVVTAFTDIDCSFCRKMHQQMAEYNEVGIEMRYLAYPRSGIDTPSYDKAVNVWCAANQQDAMTQAKAGKDLPGKDCKNPVKQHMQVGEEVGVTGTPSLVLENGQLIPGYVEPQRLLRILEQSGKS